jgi:hypothetical protein
MFKKVYAEFDYINMIQYRVQWRTLLKNGNEASGSIKGGKFLN